MDGMDAAARAAGVEVGALVRLTRGGVARVELDGEEVPVHWPAAELAAELEVLEQDLPGMRVLVTVRETLDEGRVLSGFRRA